MRIINPLGIHCKGFLRGRGQGGGKMKRRDSPSFPLFPGKSGNEGLSLLFMPLKKLEAYHVVSYNNTNYRCVFTGRGRMEQKMEELVRACGFTHFADLDPSKIQLLDEVRQMCEVNSCGMYGRNWACPPACGMLEECRHCCCASR